MSVVSIKAGQTLSSIVRDFNKANGSSFSVTDIAKANGLKDANKIIAGGKLIFPDKFETNAKQQVIKGGDGKNMVRNGVKEQVTVKAEQEQVQTQDAQISTNLTPRPLEQYPTMQASKYPDASKYGDLSNPTNRAIYDQAVFKATTPLTSGQLGRMPNPRSFGDMTKPENAMRYQSAMMGFAQQTSVENTMSQLAQANPQGAASLPNPASYGDLTRPQNFSKLIQDLAQWKNAQTGQTQQPQVEQQQQPSNADASKIYDPNSNSLNNYSGGIPDPSKFGDLTRPANMKSYQDAQLGYQQAMNRLNEMFQMLSNIEKSRSDTAKQIAGNIR